MNSNANELYRNFRIGVNLGGWLSQFDLDTPDKLTDAQRQEHFMTFITEADIRQIASWGLDHVRLPVDGQALTSGGRGAELDAEVLAAIRRCLTWCAEHRINVVLDLHDFEGNVWGLMSDPLPLLDDTAIRNFFIETWMKLATELADVSQPLLMFELLNEVSDSTHTQWNQVVAETIAAIRDIDPTRWILVGSNGQNGVAYLDELDLGTDPYVFATFHYYEPQAFTHQRAHFSEEHRDFGQFISYPGELKGFRKSLEGKPVYQEKHKLALTEDYNDRALMERLLQGAVAFIQQHGPILYCGEYGVIDTADPADAARWIQDFDDWAESHHIGRALWNYKLRDFGLVSADGSIRSETVLGAFLQNAAPRPVR